MLVFPRFLQFNGTAGFVLTVIFFFSSFLQYVRLLVYVITRRCYPVVAVQHLHDELPACFTSFYDGIVNFPQEQ